jgi:hypothetical protein
MLTVADLFAFDSVEGIILGKVRSGDMEYHNAAAEEE